MYNFQEPSRKELTSVQDDEASHQTTEDLKSPTSSGLFENPKTPSAEKETSLVKSSNNNNGAQSETSVSQPQDKTPPKKPDKILPCPRCSSMDTKFCYFNNYNVNQPRHFCKNCQRYWTAGGTMRNVPVGAGRRKNKNSSSSSSCGSHYRQVVFPEALQRAKLNSSANELHNAVLGNGGAVLTFGSDPPLCDSMASVLSLAEKTQNGVPNGFHAPKQYTLVSCYGADNHGDGNKVGASVNASTSSEKNKEHVGSHDLVEKSYKRNSFPPQWPCFPASPPWPYPWNPAMPPPPPALCKPGYPMPFYPPPTYWGYVPPSWSAHSITTSQSSGNHCATSAGPNSPTLGKHSRDGNMLSPPVSSQKDKPGTESNYNNSENGVLIPKTLRIDDPGEAARSSVWSALGIKNIDKANSSLNGGGLFKAFPSKGTDEKHHVVKASPVLQANPAALSRSLIFHERT